MDIKDLNKSQLILLAILLSFITSIATGITTVTLMEQAPPAVTTPINRIVRQTVEKIEQVQGKTITQTVVVKEEDLVVDAIEKNQSAVFTLSGSEDENAQIYGRGFAVQSDGLVAIDAAELLGGSYYLSNSSGKFKATLLATDPAGFAILKIGEPVKEESVAAFTVPTSGDLSKMKTGQKVLVLGNSISSFILDSTKNININATPGNSGALVLNLDGEALGIALMNEAVSFASIDAINEALKALEEKKS